MEQTSKQNELLELIPKCLDDDANAKESLVLMIQNQIFYHCRKMLKNEDDALDATQDILVTVLSSLHTLREPTAFWSWLNQVTANTCRYILRRVNGVQSFGD